MTTRQLYRSIGGPHGEPFRKPMFRGEIGLVSAYTQLMWSVLLFPSSANNRRFASKVASDVRAECLHTLVSRGPMRSGWERKCRDQYGAILRRTHNRFVSISVLYSDESEWL